MKCFGLLLFFLTTATAQAANWQTVANGVRYAKIPLVYAGATTGVHVLAVDPKIAALKPVVVPARASVRSMALSFDALAMINANFFDTGSKPLGLIVSNKAVLNPFKNISWWSVFCIKDTHAEILKVATYQPGQCDEAVQAGPRLVVDGQAPKLTENISKKSAVGLDAAGQVYLIATDDIVPIGFFAEFLRLKPTEGGLGLTQALNLDGGSSTQMYGNFEGVKIDVPNYVTVPVGLGVFEKSN